MTDDRAGLQFLGPVMAIPERGLAFTFGTGASAESGILVRDGDTVLAWRNRCRHLAVPLDHDTPGEFFTPDGGHMMCQQHGALYRPADGLCIWGPCRGSSLRSLSIVIKDGNVFLDLNSVPGLNDWSQPAP